MPAETKATLALRKPRPRLLYLYFQNTSEHLKGEKIGTKRLRGLPENGFPCPVGSLAKYEIARSSGVRH